MPTSTGVVETTDGYPANQESGAAIVGPFQSLATVQFTVTGASVAAQVAKMQPNSRALYWDQLETVFPPGQSGFTGVVHGIRFRSFDPGTSATVVINGYFADDPIPFTNPQPVDYTLNPDGTIVPVGGSGLFYDIDNEGTTLQVGTTGDQSFVSTGGQILVEAQSVQILADNGDMYIQGSDEESNLFMEDSTGNVELRAAEDLLMDTSGGSATIDGNTGTFLRSNGQTGVTVSAIFPANVAGLSFFGVTPVAKQATPVTLSDLVTLLRNYGLCV